jgi:HD-like signal output (HDOD) protein
MALAKRQYFEVYKSLVQKVIENDELLPSLPSVTLKIRQKLSEPDCNNNDVAEIIQLDPSLSALLLKYSSSPIYKRPVPPKTIQAVIAMLGKPVLENIVLSHSIKSLFILKDPQLKKLFQLSWERIIFKAATSQLLGQKIGYKPAEEAMKISLMTEIGTLALLSAVSDCEVIPSKENYIQLCRQYSKALTKLILKKWGIDNKIIKISHYCGKWEINTGEKFTILDVVNLAIYSTVQYKEADNDLPDIENISSYKKLSPLFKSLTPSKQLILVQENFEDIQEIIKVLS